MPHSLWEIVCIRSHCCISVTHYLRLNKLILKHFPLLSVRPSPSHKQWKLCLLPSQRTAGCVSLDTQLLPWNPGMTCLYRETKSTNMSQVKGSINFNIQVANQKPLLLHQQHNQLNVDCFCFSYWCALWCVYTRIKLFNLNSLFWHMQMSDFPELAEALCCKQNCSCIPSGIFSLACPLTVCQRFNLPPLSHLFCVYVYRLMFLPFFILRLLHQQYTLHVNTAIYWAKITVLMWFYKQSLIQYIVRHPFLDTGKYLCQSEEEKRGLQRSRTVMHCIVLYDIVLWWDIYKIIG